MFRWLVSAVFLALPIGTTLGILLGLQAWRQANGQPPPFSGGDDGFGLPGIIIPKGKDGVRIFCDESVGFDPVSKNQNFILNPNPWGWKEGEQGNICMLVDYNANRTYETAFSAPVFNVTWKYPVMSGTNNVHAYPNAKVDSKKLPAKLGTINALRVEVEWHVTLKNDSQTEITDAEVAQSRINANVAIDMFMDKDKDKSSESAKANYEVMVWFARFGDSTWPIGKVQGGNGGIVTTKMVSGVSFNLYAGQNQLTNQTVLSWVTETPANKFAGKVTDLLEEIFALNDTKYPQKTDYLGYVAFGQEAYSSDVNVTFAVPQLAIDFQTT
ncbi:uncharacterized protein UV8b_01784 [Ustilaginoidea virens]|uniref:Glycoside hydrolase family 12 protein n=1 Tax=Ustilaginoidea virens TaxID=1159556 RepID=A0A8E5HLL0_USTVR|nr:uncharacterized protein UV8b_01784 [Ustilaginoidea virens]QUC17543.1 hypothetical protein UV8b_01784 [Ustilaginoidea virens]